jgi:FkbM family methyltransferase
LRGIGVAPLSFSDNNRTRWGTEIDGVKVLPPGEAAQRYGADSAVLVTIWNEFHWFRETEEQLKSLGCNQVIPYTYLYWRFPEMFLPFLLNELPHLLYLDRDRVLAAERLWSDEESRNLYQSNIYLRATGNPALLPGRPHENTYLPPTFFEVQRDECFVDCGATAGEMAQDVLRKAGPQFSTFHAIEADHLSYRRLGDFVDALPQDVKKKFSLYNVAVGLEKGEVHFSHTGGTGSKISEEGEAVHCTPLDELFADVPITFLKMDIEGAEYDALRGAKQVLQRDQPILAICVYHTQNDIWRIPLLVKESLPEHKLFLRAYEGDGFQNVLFAVPPRRCKLQS